jgi:hypothetical protein
LAANLISWLSVTLILLASGMLLIRHDWRIRLGALAVQYLSDSWLIGMHLPFAMATVKLVTGWMIVALLGMTQLSLPSNPAAEHEDPRGPWYAIFLTGIVALATAGATTNIETAIPGLGIPVIAGSMLLIGTGLLHLSLTSDIFRVVLGLLSMLAGFETLYAGLESSILVAGLLAIVNLALGLVGCYLLMADRGLENEPSEEHS